jgi:hypothetical protein
MIFDGPAPARPAGFTRQLQRRVDTPEGRAQYGHRLTRVEPAFANLWHNGSFARFTLRDRATVAGRRTPFRRVHRIEKLARAGYAAERGSGAPPAPHEDRSAPPSARQASQPTHHRGVAYRVTMAFDVGLSYTPNALVQRRRRDPRAATTCSAACRETHAGSLERPVHTRAQPAQ